MILIHKKSTDRPRIVFVYQLQDSWNLDEISGSAYRQHFSINSDGWRSDFDSDASFRYEKTPVKVDKLHVLSKDGFEFYEFYGLIIMRIGEIDILEFTVKR